MQNQCVFAVELFPTFTAHVWPCSCVNLLVLNEVRFAIKEFSTVTELKEPFSCVNSPVFKLVRDLSEKFPAFVALVRPFTCVYGLMFEKVTALAEAFPTFAALMRSLSSVDSLMSSKRVFPGEFFPTFTAFVKLLSSTKESPTTSAHVGASFCHEGPSAEGQRQLACAFCLHHVHRYSPSQRFCSFSESLLSFFLKNFSPLCCFWCWWRSALNQNCLP